MTTGLDMKKLEKETLDAAIKEMNEKVKKLLGHSRFTITRIADQMNIDGITKEEQKKIKGIFK